MSDTPEKNNSSSNTEDASKKPASPWFVTPMSDNQEKNEEKKPSLGTDKPEEIKFQPESTPSAKEDSSGEKAAEPKPSASPPSFKPAAAPTPKAANPFTESSSITFDEEEKKTQGVSVPMLVVDSLAAAVAIVFTVLILRDVMPFL
ncbi:MAG: hypothetical protein ACNA77_04715 [Opitutales bacterium]